MLKRSLLSLSLLLAVLTGVAVAGESRSDGGIPNSDVKNTVAKSFQSYFETVLKKIKDFPSASLQSLAKGFDSTLGRLSPDSLKDRTTVKAALFVTASAAVVYACYLAYKKYIANKEENEDEAQLKILCGASRSGK